MVRRLGVLEREIAGDADTLRRIFAGDAGTWLPEPARRAGLDRWTVTVSAGRLSRQVACHVGDAWTVGDALWRPIAWYPRAEPGDVVPIERWLPTMHGQIGLRAGDRHHRLVFEVTYDPPAGPVGHVADAAAGHLVATATAERFLDDLAERLAAAAAGRGLAAR